MDELKIAHVVNYAPGLSGMYGTVRDLYLAECDLGLNAQIIDDSNSKTVYGEYGVDGVIPAGIEFAEEADIICWHHAMVEDWFNEPHRNIVMFLHGTPEFNLHTELYKEDRVLSLTVGAAVTEVARDFITMWPRHVPIWETLLNRDVQYVPAWVDYRKFKCGPKSLKSDVIRIGMLDFWRQTREPFGLFMAIDWLRKNTDKRIEVNVWGLTETPNRTYQAVIQWLVEDGVVVLRGNTPDPINDIYHKSDVILTMSSEETRVVRESYACGVPAVCGHADLEFTDYCAESIHPEQLARAIDTAHEDLCRNQAGIRRRLRRYARDKFSVETAAVEMAEIFEHVVCEHGSVNYPRNLLPGGQRQVYSVRETADAIKEKLASDEPFVYTRFGDGQLFLLDGHEGWDYWHHTNTGLTEELEAAFCTEGQGYLVACSAGQENEGKMRLGLFARHQTDEKLQEIARARRKAGTFHNAVALTYQSVFDVDWFCDLLDTQIHRRTSALVCNEQVARSELVRAVLKPDHVITIPAVDGYSEIDLIWEQLEELKDVQLVMSAAGPVSNVLGLRLYNQHPDITFLDIGSIADGLAGIPSHGWIKMMGKSYVSNYSARYAKGAPVDIIVPTFGMPDKTIKCFRALQESGAENYRVIWVDNGSRRGEVDKVMPVADAFENCELMKFDTAIGFSKAVNAGLKRSLENGNARYVLLLNNDVYVTEGFLQRMIDALEKDRHGIVGPLTSENNPQSIEALRAVVEDLPITDGKSTEEIAEMLWEQYGTSTAHVGNMVSFFCCLMRKSLVKQVGALDNKLFAYGEDNDYCMRVRRNGSTLGVALGVYVYHEHHATTGTLFREGWIDERKAEARRYLQKKYEGLTDKDKVGPLWYTVTADDGG